MNLEHAKAIVYAAESLGTDVKLREDYSGRGMYGYKTTGIVGSITDIFQAVAKAAFVMGSEIDDENDFDTDREGMANDFIEAISKWDIDNMARSMIVY